MSTYYISSLLIQKLWGHRDLDISFKKDVNIIIGPNASGKTTILNLLRFILSFDLLQLRDIEFKKVTVTLRSFDEKSTKKISVESNDAGYRFVISRSVYDVVLDPLFRQDARGTAYNLRSIARLRSQHLELEQVLKELVPAVWLPVSRRLPISDEEETRVVHSSRSMESVDVRLRELMAALKNYRLSLEAKLSLRYKEFEKSVLREILYSKEYDQFGSVSFEMTKPEDKQQLVRAFQVAGLLDNSMRKRIDEHFKAAENALTEFKHYTENRESQQGSVFPVSVLFIMPLVRRTKSIVEYARSLEAERKELFAPIEKFETIVNSFLQPKKVRIEETGDLTVLSKQDAGQTIYPHMLSSGEKQILILLIQALVREDEPVVYVADEPELSLHVKWQESLLKSLVDLTKQIQIIVATHSPDIVGGYTDNVIDLAKL